jgi:hypothetical protein
LDPRLALPGLLAVALFTPAFAGAPGVTPEFLLPCSGPCPDMTVDQGRLDPIVNTLNAGNCEVQEGTAPSLGSFRVVRFTVALPNMGPGNLAIGAPSTSNPVFKWGACHNHWHLSDYTAQRVWSQTGWTYYNLMRQLFPDATSDEIIAGMPYFLQPVNGQKTGWCVIDVSRYSQYGGSDSRTFTSCSNMGISRGWADVYSSGTSGQWVIVDDLPPGSYILEVEVNPGRSFEEASYGNNVVTEAFTLS